MTVGLRWDLARAGRAPDVMRVAELIAILKRVAERTHEQSAI